jgi:tetratricopeptide (TPR) repeat protein
MKAIESYEEGLIIVQKVQHREFEANALSGLGKAYHCIKQYNPALKCYEQTLKIRQEISHHGGEAATFKKLAEFYQDLGERDRALKYCEQALAISTKLGIPLAEECRKLKEELEKGGG